MAARSSSWRPVYPSPAARRAGRAECGSMSAPAGEVGGDGEAGGEVEQVAQYRFVAARQPRDDGLGLVAGQRNEHHAGAADAARRVGEAGHADAGGDEAEKVRHPDGPLDDPRREAGGGEVPVVLLVPWRPRLPRGEYPVLAGQVGEAELGPGGERVSGWQYRAHRFRGQGPGGQVGGTGWQGDRRVEP